MSDNFQLAFHKHQAGQLAEAKVLYQSALTKNPKSFPIRFNLATLLAQMELVEEAAVLLEETLRDHPGERLGWQKLYELGRQEKSWRRALMASHHLTEAQPDLPDNWFAYGLCLAELKNYDEANGAFLKALSLNPHHAASRLNRSIVLKKLHRFDEAEHLISESIDDLHQTRNPDATDEELTIFHWHWSLHLLARGDLLRGFSFYRARYKGGTDWQRLKCGKPLWVGEPLMGKTILVQAEQGHGDALMMSRFLPLLAERGARIIYRVHPALCRFFTQFDLFTQVISLDDALPNNFDCHISLFDLPFRFQTTRDTLPPPFPQGCLSIKARNSVSSVSRPLNVGIMIRGNTLNPRDQERSLRLEDFEDICAHSECHFVNLTREMNDRDHSLLKKWSVREPQVPITDFMDLADQLQTFDLIISCDTALVHLAAGYRRPVWALIPYNADWRWLIDEEKSPWYPEVRLYRQEREGDWGSVMQRLSHDFKTWIGSRGSCQQ